MLVILVLCKAGGVRHKRISPAISISTVSHIDLSALSRSEKEKKKSQKGLL
jgi:hypothetical protein